MTGHSELCVLWTVQCNAINIFASSILVGASPEATAMSQDLTNTKWGKHLIPWCDVAV